MCIVVIKKEAPQRIVDRVRLDVFLYFFSFLFATSDNTLRPGTKTVLRGVVGKATLFVSSCKPHRHLLQHCVRRNMRIFHSGVWRTRVNGERLFSKVLVAILLLTWRCYDKLCSNTPFLFDICDIPGLKQDGRTCEEYFGWVASVNALILPKIYLEM